MSESAPLVESKIIKVVFMCVVLFTQIAELLVCPPGSDINPYTWAHGNVRPILVAGMTLQAWSLAALAVTCAIGVVVDRQKRTIRGSVTIWIGLFSISLISLSSISFVSVYFDGLSKIVVPILIYVYVAGWCSIDRRSVLANTLHLINLMTAGQVFICRLFTGNFAALRYYYELPQEYFGYYYHLFAFAGVLGALTLFCLSEIASGRRIVMNLILLVFNLTFIYLSQVRTYLAAMTLSVVAMTLFYIVAPVSRDFAKRMTMLMFAAISSVCIAMVFPDIVGSRWQRADISSGRFERWGSDLAQFQSGSDLQIIFGRGLGYVYHVNEWLFGVSINSLNLAIDSLLDIGVAGLILLGFTWLVIFFDAWKNGVHLLLVGVFVFMSSAAVITNILEFTNVVVICVLVLSYAKFSRKDVPDEDSSAVPAAVSSSSGERLMVG